MTIYIEIDCDSAAFEDNGIATEAARIIREAAQLIEDGAERERLKDFNGSTVGRLEVKK